MTILLTILALLTGVTAGSYGALCLSAFRARTQADVLRMLTVARDNAATAQTARLPRVTNGEVRA